MRSRLWSLSLGRRDMVKLCAPEVAFDDVDAGLPNDPVLLAKKIGCAQSFSADLQLFCKNHSQPPKRHWQHAKGGETTPTSH